MIRRFAAAAALLAALCARADDPVLRPRYDLLVDGVVTGAAVGATAALTLRAGDLAPSQCRWCEPPGADASVERALRWHDTEAAAVASDALAVTMAAGALGYGVIQGHRSEDPASGWANALLITEATSIAMLLDTGLKYAVGRQRPYAWRGETRPGDAHDRNLSFPSGHATFAFALAASSSTLFLSQRVEGAREYALVAFGAAAATAYLRVAADRHYASDVLVGAALGTVVGWAIPHFFHPPASGGGLQLAAAPGGIAVVW